MVRNITHVDDEDVPDSSSPSERIRVDQKMDASRSKHSETEQRRRSKINERFQILRDLIPENDQKRDKASLLLEVIQYIRFLQDKLQMYEGTYQGWSPEPTKLAPWKINPAQVESFLHQTQLDRHISGPDDNDVVNPSLNNVRDSIESDLVGSGFLKPTDLPIAGSQTLPPVNLTVQTPTFESVSTHPCQESFTDPERFTQISQSQFWQSRSVVDDCSVRIHAAHKGELKSDSGEPTISNAYSQGVLNSLRSALQSSGVDISQTSISVQLDVGKQTNNGNTLAMFGLKDNQNLAGITSMAQVNAVENYEPPHKRFRADQS